MLKSSISSPIMPSMFSRSWSVLTPVLAFSGLLCGIEVGRPSWLTPPLPRETARTFHAKGRAGSQTPVPVADKIVGYLDMRGGKPLLFAKEGSHLDVSGWAACSVPGSSISAVRILINGDLRGEVKTFLPRPDVAAAFGRPEFEMSGWRATVSLAGLKAGDYTIVAQGIGSRGEIGTLPTFHLTVLE